MLSYKELKNRILSYIAKYGDEYNKLDNDEINELGYSIKEWILVNYYSSYIDPSYNESFFQQIFSAIGAFENDINPYYYMVQEIEKEYGLDRDIIEVGAGMFPALSNEIAKRQFQIGKGSITAYDPQLVVDNVDGITLIKDKFTESTPIKEGSLIIARKPCDATKTIVKHANSQRVEFYIDLCMCHQPPLEYKKEHMDVDYELIWPMYIEELAKSTLPTDFTLERSSINNPLVKYDEYVVKTKKK